MSRRYNIKGAGLKSGAGAIVKSLLCCMLLFSPLVVLSDEAKPGAMISIIIDDIGYRLSDGEGMINLSAPLTFAVLPNAPKAKQLANLAHLHGKEVMLHMPMQSTLGEAAEEGLLNVEMEEKDVIEALQEAFDKVPHAVGMNNHQGSLLTRHPGHMEWVMKEMLRGGYFFVDSRTSKQSVAEKIAKEQGVPTIRRDVFLDHHVDIESIKAEFNRLIKLAIKNGAAVGIAHPYAETLVVLREMLPQLEALNVQLVPVSKQFKGKRRLLAASIN
ncbi:MAG: divergent polysaccharide deacetylase family protein [Cycloclasticus sp.]